MQDGSTAGKAERSLLCLGGLFTGMFGMLVSVLKGTGHTVRVITLSVRIRLVVWGPFYLRMFSYPGELVLILCLTQSPIPKHRIQGLCHKEDPVYCFNPFL